MKAEFYRYDVRPQTMGHIGLPIAIIYARDDVEAWDKWSEFAVDGPMDVVINPCVDQIPDVNHY
jgi:hypothetical protein|tara:strand:- start:326 stop:517 length:192 start_codon:yes stop_codon:yes gene_type:complete